MKITPAKLSDIDQIMVLQIEQVKFHVQTDPEYYSNYDKSYGPNKDKQALLSDIRCRPSRIIVAKDNDKLAGFIDFSIDKTHHFDTILCPSGNIDILYVLPEYRHQQLATKLIDEVKKTLKKMGLKYLRLSVSSKNISAIKFYEKLGLIDRQHIMFTTL